MKNYALPEGYSLLRSIPRTFKQIKDPIGSMEESMRAYNGTYSVHLGRRRFIVTQDPALIEYVLKKNHRNYHKSEIQTDSLGRFLGYGLLTSNGDFWLRQRRLIQPGFHQQKIEALYSIMHNTVHQFTDQVSEGVTDVYPLMNRFAFDIVMNTLFNVAVPEHLRNELSSFIIETQNFVMKDLRQPHLSWWFKISGELRRNMDKSKRARQIIRNLISERKASGRKFNDLLDMLLEARYEDSGEPMEEAQLIDEILVLIIAGHETTANALSWMLYLLATHRSVLDDLRAKTRYLTLKEVVENSDLKSVINETMRLYPPAYISDRVSLQDDQFGAFSYPSGTIVILFYYGLHRDSRYWDNPESFSPDRFLNDQNRDRSKFFFPFGAGPRLCIGNSFALAEMAIFLQYFIHQFDMIDTGKAPRAKALVTLKPDAVILELRRINKP